MNKTELIAAVAEKAELSKKDAEKAVNALLDTVVEEVAKGEANKVFIPFEATNTLASLGAMKDIVTDKKKD